MGYARVTRPSVQDLMVSTSISGTDEALNANIDSSYTAGARSGMNHDVGSDQDTIASNVGTDQRSLSNQAIMGLGGSSLQSHLQQKQVTSYFI